MSITMEERMSPSVSNRETDALLRYLNSERAHVVANVQDLDAGTLRKAFLPSGWTCLGMIQHLALDVERFWFQAVVAGEQGIIATLASDPDAWQVADDVPATSVFEAYQQAIDRSNAIIASVDLDSPPAWWPEAIFGDFRLDTIREIVIHVLAETAGHAGQLDIVRELHDGRQWLVLTE